ncbi:protein hinderin isoform X1 [Entelurus aequoreus]|uniref:protein hinderin isoform X1 n=1 Tax=Entelurus aequoreus TaxID=161455 RepID=UPI002B1D3DA0|nr:protein hinderin isoform X1 [Entelurus aequoreus]
MAAAERRNGKSAIIWMNSVSDEDEPSAFVPGVDKVVSFKPGSTNITSKNSTIVQARCNSKAKNGGKVCNLKGDQCWSFVNKNGLPLATASATTDTSLSSGSIPPTSQVISGLGIAQSQACLKDLCPEDKRRIANLVEELARVSEEKDESVQRLQDEHNTFEHKIQQLEQQNLFIAHERENLQQQYRECQELLGLYQQYLSLQQMKLNQSITELSQAQAHSKVLSSEEATSRTTSQANGLLFDGSYLSHAATQAQQPQVRRRSSGRAGALQTASVSTPISYEGQVCPPDEHTVQTRECEPQHYQGTFQDSRYGTQQRTTNGHTPDNSCQNTFIQRHQGGDNLAAQTREALTSPLLGRKDWEEKRHQLLLQNMQLEMEREKLRARLADQEERISRQNQQLCQSRLDCKKLQEARQSKLSTSIENKKTPQSDAPHHQDLAPSGTENGPGPQRLRDSASQTAPLDRTLGSCEAASVLSKKDTATSAEVPASPAKLVMAPATRKTSENRSDFSLVELLDLFSPVSAHGQRKMSSRRAKSSQRGPALTTPKSFFRGQRPHPLSRQQDLEESQILEDIFFIC